MRLFIGLPLNAAAQADTAAISQRISLIIPGRYVLNSNYHLTLAFLGEVSEDRLSDAKDALDTFAARFFAPRLTLGHLSYFNQPSNAILIRTAQSPDDLRAMHLALIHELNARTLPHTDAPFTPHVTLARHARLDNPASSALWTTPVSFTPPHAVLYLSTRDKENILRYTPLHTAAFAHPRHC